MTVSDVHRAIHAVFGLESARLIAGLPAGHPARLLGEQEMARLASLGFDGEQRGHRAEPVLSPLASVNDPTAR